MRPLVIGEEALKGIAKLKAYAEAEENIVSTETLKKMMAGKILPIGFQGRHSLDIPVGFRVVYSVEDQPRGLCRHISVSVDAPGRSPHPEAINLMLAYFGFDGRVSDKGASPEILAIWMEKGAVNILEPCMKSSEKTPTRNPDVGHA